MDGFLKKIINSCSQLENKGTSGNYTGCSPEIMVSGELSCNVDVIIAGWTDYTCTEKKALNTLMQVSHQYRNVQV